MHEKAAFPETLLLKFVGSLLRFLPITFSNSFELSLLKKRMCRYRRFLRGAENVILLVENHMHETPRGGL